MHEYSNRCYDYDQILQDKRLSKHYIIALLELHLISQDSDGYAYSKIGGYQGEDLLYIETFNRLYPSRKSVIGNKGSTLMAITQICITVSCKRDDQASWCLGYCIRSLY